MGRVFISYAREDFDIAERLYRDLKDAGANPWMDVKNLVAGKRWKSAIQREIRESSHIIVLLSSRALSKRGFVQKEINQALEVWAEVPPDKIYLIPVRLDECTPRHDQLQEIQWVNLFPSYELGLQEIKRALEADDVIPTNKNAADPALQTDMTSLRDIVTSAREPIYALDQEGQYECNSVAVLPFVNLSSQAENEYFCDGLAEELLNALAKIEGLHVAARTSAFSFKGKNANVSVIGRALNVETVLEGAVRKSGNRLRITVQLVNTDNGYQLWSERYDREMRDIFDVQDEITLAIVDILKVKLLGGAKATPVMRHTENVEAYQLYLKGRYYWNKWTRDGFKKSMECFTQAIRIDPNYALAYSGLADGFSTLGLTFAPPREVFPKAKAEATNALGIDDMLSEAHTSLGIVNLFYDWDWVTAEREIQRAIELNRSNQAAHLLYYWYLLVWGRNSDALAEIKKAQELDPLSHVINTSVGWSLYLAGEYDQAIEQHTKVLEMDPNFLPAYASLARIYSQRQMHSEAFAVIQRNRDLQEDNAHILTLLGYTYAAFGNREEAQKVLDELIELSVKSEVRIDPSEIAIVCAGLGELDQAFEWLDIAYEYRSPNMIWLKVDPIWDSLRSDLRFAKLLHRMGLTP